MKFEDCLEENKIIKISQDERRAKSLRKVARDRLKYLDKEEITKLNCSFILEHYYSALIEFLHSIALKRGYKILNHLCITSFIREVLNRKDISKEFDKFRKIRNNLVYYGRRLDSKIAKKRIKEIKKIINQVQKI